MHKIIKIALIVLGLIGAVLWTQLPSSELVESNPGAAAESGAMNLMFVITFVLLGIGAAAALIFTLKNLFSTPASLKKSLFSILGFLLIVLISYGLASGTDLDANFLADMDASESTVRKIGTGLNTFFILTALAVVLMIVPGVKKLIGK